MLGSLQGNQQELNRTKGVVHMKAIKNYVGLYSVTTDGKIFSHRSNRFLKNQETKNGYEVITLCSKDIKEVKYIHRIVAETYIDNHNNLPIINHKDGNKKNNKLTNLEWTTYSGNLIHAYENELRDKRKDHSDEICCKIFQYLIDGWRQKDVAETLGISVGVIKGILNNPAYEDIRSEFNLDKIPSRSNKITPEKVILIAKELENGIAQNKIAVKFNVAKSLVSQIKTRKVYSTLTSDFNF